MKKALYILSFLCISGVFAQAEDKKADKKSNQQSPMTIPEDAGVFQRTFIRANQGAASAVDAMGARVDMFLSGAKYTSKKNKSTITVKNGAYWQEGEGDNIDYTTQFDARLHLPNLESKWALRFTSYDEDEDERGINQKRPKTAPRKTNYGTSIAFLQKLGDIDVTFRPRVRLKKGLETSHLLKFESEAELNKVAMRPRLELFAEASKGTGELFALDFGYELSKDVSFFISNEQEYIDFENKLSTNHEFSVSHILSDDKSMKYALLYESNNKPRAFHLYEYVFYITYAHSVYKDMLHFSVTPRVFFNEENSFRPKDGLSIGLDLIF